MDNKLFEKELSREYPFKGKIFDVAVCKAELPDGAPGRGLPLGRRVRAPH